MIVRKMMPSEGRWLSNYDEFDGLRRQMQGLMGDMEAALLGRTGAAAFPALNVTLYDENLYVRAELPGMRASELQVTAVKNRLSLAGTRQVGEDEGVSYHRRERAGGHFNRSIVLPIEFQGDKVSAEYVDGILTVTLPRTPEAKPKQIRVKTV